MRGFKALCAHITVVLSLMFLVFLTLDQLNPLMNFVGNDISTVLLGVLCVSGVSLGILTYADKEGKRHG